MALFYTMTIDRIPLCFVCVLLPNILGWLFICIMNMKRERATDILHVFIIFIRSASIVL